MLGIFLDCKSWLGSCTSQYPFTLAAKKVQWFARKGVQLYLLIRVPSTVLNDLLRDPDSWPLHLFEKVRYLVECESYQTSDKGFDKSLVNLYLFLPKPGREPFWPVFEWLGEYNEPLLACTQRPESGAAKKPVEMSSPSAPTNCKEGQRYQTFTGQQL